MNKYAVVFEAPSREDGNWSGFAPDLPGLAVTGETLEDCRRSMASGIAVYLDECRKMGYPVPPPTTRTEEMQAA